MNNKKLITFGCSFTDSWSWPSWSSWMGYFFTDYTNKARGGTGNTAIFHSVLKAVEENLLTPGSYVGIQWSGIVREDKMEVGILSKDYRHTGNVIHNDFFSDEYISKYFNPYQNTFETINYINALHIILKELKVNYFMTFMLNPTVGDMFGEPGFRFEDSRIKRGSIELAKELYPNLHKTINDKFIPISMSEYCLENPKYVYAGVKSDGEPYRDGHPSPLQHFNYMREYITPRFPELNFQYSQELFDLVDKWQTYAEIKLSTEDKIHLSPDIYPSQGYRGGYPIKVKTLNFNV